MITEDKQEQRYDRQIRLWGVQGQRRLTKSSICLIGCGGAGVEALKNLVLPGVGQIVIVDDARVKRQNLGISFFLERSSVDKSLAAETVKFLLEMNPYVKGIAVEKSATEAINEEFLSQHTLIISNQLSEQNNNLLSRLCEKINKPLIILNTYGFYAYIRNQMVCHEIHEVKQNKKYDLRIREPFEGLVEHCNSFNIDELIKNQEDTKNAETLGHIPYGILLVKAFKLSQNKTSKEIKQIIVNWRKQINPELVENFNEAERNLMVVNQKKENLFEDLKIILDHSKCLNANEESKLFWKFSKSLKNYIQLYNNYPQSHDLPDMHASTDAYINLKDVYKKENNRTKQIFVELFSKQFPNSKYEQIEIDTFLENILSLSIVEMRPYYQELENPQFTFDGDWPQIYSALRAADHYKQKYCRVPTPSDFDEVKNELRLVLDTYPEKNVMMPDDKIIQEVCRAQQSQLISISSIAGSIAAQEAIKLITHLFTPMNSGYFFNGAKTEGFMTEM